jgi:ribonuclease D
MTSRHDPLHSLHMPTLQKIPLLIQEQAHLDQACEVISAHDQIVIDTEFVRTNTYAPHLGLVQIAAGDTIVCVDPLADMDMGHYWDLLFDPARANILHSGSQDMEVLWFTCKQVIQNPIDTQVCSALLGYPAQIGYAGLAKELLDVDISKDQTRTDWTRRPLTDAQLKYAAEDVEHLGKMHDILKQRLSDLGRYEWALEDSRLLCNISLYKPAPDKAWQRLTDLGRYEWALEDSRLLCNTSLYKPAPDKAWQRLKSIPFLPADQQARARVLAAWREQRAVNSDKPRGWILSDKALLHMAEQNPARLAALNDINDMPQGLIRNQGERLLNVITDANKALASGTVSYQQIVPDRDKDKALLKKLSAIVRAEAEKLGIANEVLGSKRDIQALIRGEGNSRITNGWRNALIGEAMLAEIPAE